MASEENQVRALQQAILKRAQQLADEHVEQGRMTRDKILEDMREKIKLMEQKELLSARVHADREYQRQVQASELRMQAEQDRNRWGLVQSVQDSVIHQINEIHQDKKRYETMFRSLLKISIEKISHVALSAYVSSEDYRRYSERWQSLVEDCCGKNTDITLSDEECECSGGFKLMSKNGDIMLDNTFEGLYQRKNDEMQRIIFERLFSGMKMKGGSLNG